MTLDSGKLRSLHPHHPHTGNASDGTLYHGVGSRDQEGHVFGISTAAICSVVASDVRKITYRRYFCLL